MADLRDNRNVFINQLGIKLEQHDHYEGAPPNPEVEEFKLRMVRLFTWTSDDTSFALKCIGVTVAVMVLFGLVLWIFVQ